MFQHIKREICLWMLSGELAPSHHPLLSLAGSFSVGSLNLHRGFQRFSCLKKTLAEIKKQGVISFESKKAPPPPTTIFKALMESVSVRDEDVTSESNQVGNVSFVQDSELLYKDNEAQLRITARFGRWWDRGENGQSSKGRTLEISEVRWRLPIENRGETFAFGGFSQWGKASGSQVRSLKNWQREVVVFDERVNHSQDSPQGLFYVMPLSEITSYLFNYLTITKLVWSR